MHFWTDGILDEMHRWFLESQVDQLQNVGMAGLQSSHWRFRYYQRTSLCQQFQRWLKLLFVSWSQIACFVDDILI